MGLFLSLSGVLNTSEDDVEKALKDYSEAKEGQFYQQQGTTNDPNIMIIGSKDKNVSVLYPEDFYEWDDVSAYISRKLSTYVFSLHIHDGDFWMFILYQNGKEIAKFNPLPDYWDEHISDEEKNEWSGNPELISRIIGSITAEAIEKYFINWNMDEEEPAKAYDSDEFTYLDAWQMCDFMNKIGLLYPMDDKSNILGETYFFSIPEK